MSKFPKELEKIIVEEHDNTSDKLIGINFLEKFKFNLIPRLEPIVPLFKEFNGEAEHIIQNIDQKFEAKVFSNNDKILNFKKEIKDNSLYIVISGLLKIEIFEKETKKNITQINLYPKMGLCLSSETSINLILTTDTIIIRFKKIEINTSIENIK